MDDFKIIIYILAAVAYFVLTQWRKAFKGGGEDKVDVEPRIPLPRQQPPRPVTSFEDILRELQPKMEQARQQGQEVMQQSKERTRELVQPAMAPVAESAPKYRNYDEIAPKVMSWEKRAQEIEASKRAPTGSAAAFKEYDRQVAKPNRYAEMLRNPASVRDAFILTEIFNKKYN